MFRRFRELPRVHILVNSCARKSCKEKKDQEVSDQNIPQKRFSGELCLFSAILECENSAFFFSF